MLFSCIFFVCIGSVCVGSVCVGLVCVGLVCLCLTCVCLCLVCVCLFDVCVFICIFFAWTSLAEIALLLRKFSINSRSAFACSMHFYAYEDYGGSFFIVLLPSLQLSP